MAGIFGVAAFADRFSTVAGQVDQAMVRRVLQGYRCRISDGVQEIHLLLQWAAGMSVKDLFTIF